MRLFAASRKGSGDVHLGECSVGGDGGQRPDRRDCGPVAGPAAIATRPHARMPRATISPLHCPSTPCVRLRNLAVPFGVDRTAAPPRSGCGRLPYRQIAVKPSHRLRKWGANPLPEWALLSTAALEFTNEFSATGTIHATCRQSTNSRLMPITRRGARRCALASGTGKRPGASRRPTMPRQLLSWLGRCA